MRVDPVDAFGLADFDAAIGVSAGPVGHLQDVLLAAPTVPDRLAGKELDRRTAVRILEAEALSPATSSIATSPASSLRHSRR